MRKIYLPLATFILAAGFAIPSIAQTAPKGWSATSDGISKGSSKVTIGDVQTLAGKTPQQFMADLEMTPPSGAVFVSSGGIKDGKYVIQMKREITIDGTKARSVLMLCKSGVNENRLIEVFSENSKVLDLIGGAKYAINVCAK